METCKPSASTAHSDPEGRKALGKVVLMVVLTVDR